jgi:hypothetical protein
MHSRKAIAEEFLSLKWVSCLWFMVESGSHGSGELCFSGQEHAVVIPRDVISHAGGAEYMFVPRE